MLAIPSTPPPTALVGRITGVSPDAMPSFSSIFSASIHTLASVAPPRATFPERLTCTLGLPGSVPEEADSDTEGSVLS